MRRVGGLRSVLVTAMAGVLLGYVAASFAKPLGAATPFGAGESPEARAYVLGLLTSNASEVLHSQADGKVTSRAMTVKRIEGTVGTFTVERLTYLGGGSAGPVSVQVYVAQLSNPDANGLISLTLTLVNGKVVQLE